MFKQITPTNRVMSSSLGKTPTHLGSALDLVVDTFERMVGCNLLEEFDALIATATSLQKGDAGRLAIERAIPRLAWKGYEAARLVRDKRITISANNWARLGPGASGIMREGGNASGMTRYKKTGSRRFMRRAIAEGITRY